MLFSNFEQNKVTSVENLLKIRLAQELLRVTASQKSFVRSTDFNDAVSSGLKKPIGS